jgi:Tol biopolymer transport system component
LIAIVVLVSAGLHGQTTGAHAQAQTETWRFALTRMIDGYQNRYIDVGVLTCDTSSTAGQSGDTPACTFQVTASTRDRFYAENPTFSPADDWLAFIGESGDLYTATALELQPIQITQNESAYRKPDWSADGQWLLFDSSVGLEDKAIKAVRSDGSETPIIVSPGGITAGSPTGSSSGDEFAYITFTFDDSELVLSRLSEPGITRVLTEVNRPVRVRWSPVDDRLAVLNLNEQTSGLDLITINSDGSGYREYPTTFSEISDLEWAPDGSAIFFSFLNFLFRLDLDTGTVTMVYANLNQANGAMSDGTFSLARMDTVAPTATATGEPAPSPTP